MGAFLGLLNPITTILDKVLPDKAANDAAKAQLVQLQVNGDIQNALAQIEVDKTEAASNSTFVAGWRPFIGWVCGGAIAFDTIMRPLVNWLTAIAKHPINAPALDMSTLIPLLAGLLGFGAMRSYDKTQGVGNGH